MRRPTSYSAHSQPGSYTTIVPDMRARMQADLEQLGKLANIFLLPAESLKTLIEGELRLTNAQALPLVRLRADCKTARLEEAFSGM